MKKEQYFLNLPLNHGFSSSSHQITSAVNQCNITKCNKVKEADTGITVIKNKVEDNGILIFLPLDQRLTEL